jgi:PAS domain S-box-containing protein
MPPLNQGRTQRSTTTQSLKPTQPPDAAVRASSTDPAFPLPQPGTLSGEKRFENLLESAPGAIVVIDQIGHIQMVNARTEEMFGYPRGELVGQPVEILLPEHVRPIHSEHRNTYFETPEQRPMGEGRDLAGRRRDGTEFPVEIGLSYATDDSGVLGIALIADITERKRAQESLAYQSLLLSNVNDAIVASDSNLNLTYWNKAAEAMYGWTAQEALGKPGKDFTQTHFPDADRETMLRAIREEGGWRGEVMQTGKSGIPFPVEISSLVTRDQAGNFTGYLTVNRDITERKQAEDKLRESEERFRFIFERSTIGKSLTAPDGRLIQVNQAFADLVGYTVEEMHQINFALISHPDEIAMTREYIRSTLANERQSFRFEKRYIHKNGSIVWADVSTTLLRSDDGTPLYFLTGITDITLIKQVEADRITLLAQEQAARVQAEAARERLRLLAEASAILASSLDYETTLANVAKLSVAHIADWCTIDLVQQDDEILRSITVEHKDPEMVQFAYDLRQRFPPDPSAQRGVYKVIRSGEPEMYPDIPDSMLEASPQNDEQRAILRRLSMKSAMIVPIRIHEQTLGAISFISSESDRHYEPADLLLAEGLAHRAATAIENAQLYENVQLALAEVQRLNDELEQRVAERTIELEVANRELRYQAEVLKSVSDAIMLTGPDFLMTGWNEAAQAMLGWTPADVIGRRGSEVFKTRFIGETVETVVQQLLEQGAWYGEMGNTHKDGHEVFTLVSTSAIRDAVGTVTGYVSIARDITERKQAEERISQLNESLVAQTTLLESANKELEAFSYSVSHDLRAPLRSLSGFSQILLEKYAANIDPQAVRYLEYLNQDARHMGTLIDDLLAFSRLGRHDLKKQPVDPALLVSDVLQDHQAEIDERHISISLGDLPSCQADPSLLKQVYVNLIANAVKFTGKQPQAHIEIGCDRQEGKQVYYVKDNGAGFDMAYADRLFGVFQRLHLPEEFEGTGVGLAIVQRIVNRHGGQVWCDATPDVGAAFYFTLEGVPSDA